MTRVQEIKVWSDRIFDQIKLADLRLKNRGGSLVKRAKSYICENIYKAGEEVVAVDMMGE